jgi:hypothetical protein
VEIFAMIDFDAFERGLGDALRVDADRGIRSFDPAVIARAAIATDRSRTRSGHAQPERYGRAPRRTWLLVAAAVAIGFSLVGGALVGGLLTTPTPGPTFPSPTESAIPSPSVRAASWTATGGMARPRQSGVAVPLLDGTVLVIGGNSNVGEPAAELYDPQTGRWTATAPMVTSEWQVTATRLLDGRVLVTSGGGDPSGPSIAELYDPSTRSWAATGSLGTPRWDASATLLPDGKVLVAGGDTFTHSFNPSVASAELYDPVTGSWAATGSMDTARSWHTATSLRDGKVLVAGGVNLNDTLSYTLATAELYDPGTGTWARTGDMTEVRQSHTATLLGDGSVLVASRVGQDSTTAEVYDPTTGSWTAAGSLSAPLEGFTATLLLDGRVLVAGGMDTRPFNASDAPATAAAELYDANTGTWSATIEMIQARTRHTATLLLDGRVLVAAGISVRGSYSGETDGHDVGWLSSAELYDPGSGR